MLNYNQNRDLAPRIPIDAYIQAKDREVQSTIANEMALDSLTQAIRAQPVAPGDDFLREEKLQDIQNQINQFAEQGDMSGAQVFINRLASKHLSDPEWVAATNRYQKWEEDEAFRRQMERQGRSFLEVPGADRPTVTVDENGNRIINQYQPRYRAVGDYAPARDRIFDQFRGEKITQYNPATGSYETIDRLTPESVGRYVDQYGMAQYRATDDYINEMQELQITNPDKSTEELDQLIKDRLITHGMEKTYMNAAERKAPGSNSGQNTLLSLQKQMKDYQASLLDPTATDLVGNVVRDMWWGSNVGIPVREVSTVKPKNTDLGAYVPQRKWFRLTGSDNNQAWKPNAANDPRVGELDWSDVSVSGFATLYEIRALPKGQESIGDNESKAGDLLTYGSEGSLPREDGAGDKGTKDYIIQEKEDGIYAYFGEDRSQRVEVAPVPMQILHTADGSMVAERLSRADAIESGFRDYVDNPFISFTNPETQNELIDFDSGNDEINKARGVIEDLAYTDPVVADWYTSILQRITEFNKEDFSLTKEKKREFLSSLNMDFKALEDYANRKLKRYMR